MIDRVIAHSLPACPGRDSRFTIRHNPAVPNVPWWVFYEGPAGPVPADGPHPDLVELVNILKTQRGNAPGGAFSINEHSQVIARMSAPAGAKEQAHHVVALDLPGAGSVRVYKGHITFGQGAMDPMSLPTEGDPWPGPLCGMTYRFTAPGNPKAPSRNTNEVWVEVAGCDVQLSSDAGVEPYPPQTGPLANFLAALRRLLPNGGRFRVNEHRRAFTAGGGLFIGTVPDPPEWFRPLTANS